MKLLIATHNKAKLSELRMGVASLQKVGIEILSLNDLNITKDPEETGKTFEENSRLKASFYGELTGIPTIADDGGLTICALNGEPGIKSRRWLGKEASDSELIQYTLKRLSGFAHKDRSASLCLSLCYFNPKSHIFITTSEEIQGHIAEKQCAKSTKGFPYRALFIVSRFGKYYDELSEKEHDLINHRFKAIKRMSHNIEKDLIQ